MLYWPGHRSRQIAGHSGRASRSDRYCCRRLAPIPAVAARSLRKAEVHSFVIVIRRGKSLARFRLGQQRRAGAIIAGEAPFLGVRQELVENADRRPRRFQGRGRAIGGPPSRSKNSATSGWLSVARMVASETVSVTKLAELASMKAWRAARCLAASRRTRSRTCGGMPPGMTLILNSGRANSAGSVPRRADRILR
jgi:hypothetical protein